MERDLDGASAYRCTICAINWRPLPANKKCHQCGENTGSIYRDRPIPDDEALELGGPISIGKSAYDEWEMHELTDDDELVIKAFAQWLNTVGPEDFRATIQYPPGHETG